MKTAPIRLNPECVSCLVKKQIGRYPAEAERAVKIEYMQSVLRTIADVPTTMSAPEVMDEIYRIQERMFGAGKDYSRIKEHFNSLMLELAPSVQMEIGKSASPLKTAVQYAMMGNYIDFAAMDSVDENKLIQMLSKAADTPVREDTLLAMEADLKQAKELVYLTDNCGEIVLDKLLIQEIQKLYPDIEITVIVRGKPVVNDATIEDAEQVGLPEMVRVIDNGSSVGGTCIEGISEEAKNHINGADIIISKGQGNFETLQKCGLNVYYIFMCKCSMFADRFGVPLYSGILINDHSV